MAINYGTGQAPKGPSNSNNLSSTPGTQQTALKNVGGLNLNPNMPAGPQMQKRGRSDYQGSLMGRAQAPRKPQAPVKPSGQVVTRGMPMGQGRGYNIFSGMNAGEISDMNKNMGLSNMTSLPQMPASGAGFGLKPGTPQSMQLMAGGVPTSIPQGMYDSSTVKVGVGFDGSTVQTDIATGDVTIMDGEFAGTYTAEEYADLVASESGNYGAAIPITALEDQGAEEEGFDLEGFVEEKLTDAEGQDMGFDPEKKAQAQAYLDDKYANLLQQALSGVNRQAAMMGAGIGSGAYSALMNGAMANVLSQMSDEYAAIELADMQQAEDEYYQNLGVQMDLANMLAGLSDPQAGLFEKIEISNAIGDQVFGGVKDVVNNLPSDNAYNAASQPLNMVMDMFNEEMLNADGPVEQEQIMVKYNKIAEALFNWINLYAQYSQYAINKLQSGNKLSPSEYQKRNNEIASKAAIFFQMIGKPELVNQNLLTI